MMPQHTQCNIKLPKPPTASRYTATPDTRTIGVQVGSTLVDAGTNTEQHTTSTSATNIDDTVDMASESSDVQPWIRLEIQPHVTVDELRIKVLCGLYKPSVVVVSGGCDIDHMQM